MRIVRWQYIRLVENELTALQQEPNPQNGQPLHWVGLVQQYDANDSDQEDNMVAKVGDYLKEKLTPSVIYTSRLTCETKWESRDNWLMKCLSVDVAVWK